MSLTFTEVVGNDVLVKNLYQVADLSAKTIKGTDGVSFPMLNLSIAGLSLAGNTVAFLTAADAAPAVANNLLTLVTPATLISMANTGNPAVSMKVNSGHR